MDSIKQFWERFKENHSLSSDLPEAFAALEGEGDLSYKYWHDEHERFFRKELSSFNVDFSFDIDLVCQEFKVVDINH